MPQDPQRNIALVGLGYVVGPVAERLTSLGFENVHGCRPESYKPEHAEQDLLVHIYMREGRSSDAGPLRTRFDQAGGNPAHALTVLYDQLDGKSGMDCSTFVDEIAADVEKKITNEGLPEPIRRPTAPRLFSHS
ncbi:MAG: hypothetical protein OXR66_01280 [Candidatus Woesearchaeota archaeon]|nr:hypothetical protein [Candidatus Woesearchaeota archaeon]